MGKRKKQARVLRIFRKIHRTTGALLFVFFFFISVTGLLLGWKKNTDGYILPKTQEGTTSNLQEWLPVDSLHTIACNTLHTSVSPNLSLELDRIDLRKDKGSVKFVFVDHFYEIQLDGATGNVLSIGQRRSDFLENVHDGSILDRYLGTSGAIKLVYTSVMGVSLLMFTITGFWLWYGPKRMRKESKNSQKAIPKKGTFGTVV
ncbi:PepSY domain-containing protein [Muricauda sp. CAU 1633]|uniref:PepSY-associated TM helix domain-containing protein n=1 Tax=Allomuricauda sp. CAU 1633 TaxID=2816036 RepID=UPI001A8CCCF8|nr:PepSY-associated TM helix domain-containing protein [Muricauda sp. CAU 1633]MBO0321969.1 PepSY domain-containing protein [Muricauda sp. CAU 1633]